MATTPAFPAATLLLVRDGPAGLEVLMIQRPAGSGFAAGALVFPGGRVDAQDEAWARTFADADLARYRAAAIRETWEEAGILLARRRGANDLIDGDVVQRVRDAHPAHTVDLATLFASEDLELAADGLFHFAHWITPETEPRCFDTQFFIAAAPNQIAVADGGEALHCRWVGPNALMREADAGRIALMFPTRLNLMRLDRSRSVAQALDNARNETVATVKPIMFVEGGERIIRIEPDSGYDVTEIRYPLTPR